MRAAITVQMQLDTDTPRYEESQVHIYEELINLDLRSNVKIVGLKDLDNPAGPDFDLELSGHPRSVIADIMQLVGDEFGVMDILLRFERFEEEGLNEDHFISNLSREDLSRLVQFLEESEAELIEE